MPAKKKRKVQSDKPTKETKQEPETYPFMCTMLKSSTDYWEKADHPVSNLVISLMMSQALISKIHSMLSANQKRDKNQSAKRSKIQKQDAKQAVQYTRWLMKSEPESRIEKGVDVKFGIEDLKNEPDQTTCWDGVRNYQARNFMRDQMKNGQLAFFYHSNCKPPGIAGIVEIVKESYVDYTQFDKADPHYDPGAKKDNPKWFMVDVKFVRMMKRFIPLQELKTLHQNHKSSGGPLKSLSLFTSARLSVQPVTEEEFEFICSLEDKPEDDTS